VTTEGGEDWFLHFQDRGVYGRVVHLQPMLWRDDDWPVMGQDDGSGRGSPVLVYHKPAVPGHVPITAPASSDEFTGRRLGEQWTWQANADPSWASLRGGRLRLACPPSPNAGDLRQLPNVLGQLFPAESFVATTSLALSASSEGARAGLVVLGFSYAWVGLQRTGSGLKLVYRTAATDTSEVDAADPIPVSGDRVRLQLQVSAGGVCWFAADPDGQGLRAIGGQFTATQGKWIGATLGLFGTAPDGSSGRDTATFDWFLVGPA
jgi:beta-xylosidase